MKNTIAARIAFFTLIVISLTGFRCNKRTTDRDFCELQRSTHSTINLLEGTIIYSNKYNRFGVGFPVTTPGGVIDTQIIGLVCDIQSEFKTTGLKVIVTGTLKNFNSNENIKPEMGGQELYYLEINKIAKK